MDVYNRTIVPAAELPRSENNLASTAKNLELDKIRIQAGGGY